MHLQWFNLKPMSSQEKEMFHKLKNNKLQNNIETRNNEYSNCDLLQKHRQDNISLVHGHGKKINSTPFTPTLTLLKIRFFKPRDFNSSYTQNISLNSSTQVRTIKLF